jgi:uncharacterized membrane protein HdeD (DUF308 family)
MSRGRGAYLGATTVFSVILVVLGVVALVRTILAGASGPAVGYVLGVGLVAAGVLRLIVLRRQR